MSEVIEMVAQPEVAKEPEYVLRDLEADDLFLLTNVIADIGIDEFKNCIQSENVKKAFEDGNFTRKSIGFEVFLEASNVILKNLSKCKGSLYILLSELSGKSEADIKKMPLVTFIKMVTDLFKKKEFKDFFMQASELFK